MKTEKFNVEEKIDILNIDEFLLNNKNEKQNQIFFHFVLSDLIDKYNKLSIDERKKEGIYYIPKYAFIANIKEETVEYYSRYNELFEDLMKGKTNFYKPYKDTNSINSYKCKSLLSYNNNNSNKYRFSNNKRDHFSNNFGKAYSSNSQMNDNKAEEYEDKNKKILYNLNHFSYYFNGIFFENIAIKSVFKAIAGNNQKGNSNINQNNEIRILPRMIFYLKNECKECKETLQQKSKAYDEVDCAFIFKGKNEQKLKKEIITCYKEFNFEDISKFYNIDNFQEIVICKDDIVIIETKSSWVKLNNKLNNKKKLEQKGNEFLTILKMMLPKIESGQNEIDQIIGMDPEKELEKFIFKAIKFVKFYDKLALIKKKQQIKLVYLYNNTLTFKIEEDKAEIIKAYSIIDKINNVNKIGKIQLYIAYLQPYVKLLNAYEESQKINKLEKTMNEQQNQIEKQKIKIEELTNDIINLKNQIMKMYEMLQFNNKNNDQNNNSEIQKNNEEADLKSNNKIDDKVSPKIQSNRKRDDSENSENTKILSKSKSDNSYIRENTKFLFNNQSDSSKNNK